LDPKQERRAIWLCQQIEAHGHALRQEDVAGERKLAVGRARRLVVPGLVTGLGVVLALFRVEHAGWILLGGIVALLVIGVLDGPNDGGSWTSGLDGFD
jgi:hypothetical protein